MARIQVLPDSEELGIVDVKTLLAGHEHPTVDPVTGLPDKVCSYVVNEDPRISVAPAFFTDEECRHLMGLGAGHWIRSLVGTYATDQGEDDAGPQLTRPDPTTASKDATRTARKSSRTSQSCILRYAQTSIVERLEHRLAAYAGLPVEQLEKLVLVRYSPGEHFLEHHDGKFRPRTIFVYLNDLPDGDQGDTYFPHLGLSFVPRGGCAVMWSNAKPDGSEDSRLVHAGRAPKTEVKYGVNCFFNDERVRVVNRVTQDFTEGATFFEVSSLTEKLVDKPVGETSFVILKDPKLVVVPGFLNNLELAQISSLLDQASPCESKAADVGAATVASPDGSTSLVRVFGAAETPLISRIEQRLANVAGFQVVNMSPFRATRPGTIVGLCSRGCGQRGAVLNLSDRDEILFPHIGLRLGMGRGDLLVWPNAWATTEVDGKTRVIEDLRTVRVHRGSCGDGKGSIPLSIEVSFHDIHIRDELQAEQARRQLEEK